MAYASSYELSLMENALDTFMENMYLLDEGATAIDMDALYDELDTLRDDIAKSRQYLDAAAYLTTVYPTGTTLEPDMNTLTDVSRIVRKASIPCSYDDCQQIVGYYNRHFV